jgi:hypothetical protein
MAPVTRRSAPRRPVRSTRAAVMSDEVAGSEAHHQSRTPRPARSRRATRSLPFPERAARHAPLTKSHLQNRHNPANSSSLPRYFLTPRGRSVPVSAHVDVGAWWYRRFLLKRKNFMP